MHNIEWTARLVQLYGWANLHGLHGRIHAILLSDIPGLILFHLSVLPLFSCLHSNWTSQVRVTSFSFFLVDFHECIAIFTLTDHSIYPLLIATCLVDRRHDTSDACLKCNSSTVQIALLVHRLSRHVASELRRHAVSKHKLYEVQPGS